MNKLSKFLIKNDYQLEKKAIPLGELIRNASLAAATIGGAAYINENKDKIKNKIVAVKDKLIENPDIPLSALGGGALATYSVKPVADEYVSVYETANRMKDLPPIDDYVSAFGYNIKEKLKDKKRMLMGAGLLGGVGGIILNEIRKKREA